MKMVSGLALAATLIGLGCTVSAAPALAKKDEVAPATPTVSPKVVVGYNGFVDALKLVPPDPAAAETSLAAAEAAVTTDYERYIVGIARLRFEKFKTQGQDDAARAARLAPFYDAVIANPATPKAELGQDLEERGRFALASRKYADAAQFLGRARDAGVQSDPLLIVVAKRDSGDVRGALVDLDTAIKAEKAAGRKVPESWYLIPVAQFQKTNPPETDAWTQQWLTEYGTRENWRKAVLISGLTFTADLKARLNLYRLLGATKSLAGQKDYYDYADLALNIVGLPDEARLVLEEGFANGAIPAKDAQATALLTKAKIGGTKADAKEKAARAGASPDLARQAGDSYLAVRNFPKAVEMYQLADSKGFVDKDRINVLLGIALAQAGDRDQARAVLAKVSGDPAKAVARIWAIYAAVPSA